MTEHRKQPFLNSKRIVFWLVVTAVALCALIVMVHVNTAPAQILPADVQAATVPPKSDGTYPCVFLNAAEPSAHPQLGRCSNPSDHSQAIDRLEVDLRYASFVVRQSDLFVEDVFQVPLTRTYFSGDWIDVDRPHSFGKNTSHPYDLEPLGSRNPYTYLNLVFEDGVPLYFGRISSGTEFSNAVYMHTDTSTRFYKATISWNGNGWTLHMPDGSSMLFPEAYESKTVGQGAVVGISDGQGNQLRLLHDRERHLGTIETPHGRRIQLSYDESDRVAEVQDDQSQHVKYTYNPAGMLTDVLSTSGWQRHYGYQGTRMTTVADEHGRVLVTNTYESGNLIQQQYATGEMFRFSYRFSTDTNRVKEALVTFPDATTQTLNLPLTVHPDTED